MKIDLEGHRRAMDLVEEAGALAREGLEEAARERYREAAGLEEGCADAVGEDHPRTRGILRVSAVSAWKLAHLPSHAEALAQRYLAEPLAPGFARELRGILDEIQREAHTAHPRDPGERSHRAARPARPQSQSRWGRKRPQTPGRQSRP